MSSKTETESKSRPRGLARPRTLAIRLAVAFGAACFGLLLLVSILMYWMLASRLDVEDTQYLAEKIAAVESLLRRQPTDVNALRRELERESQSHFYAPVLIRVFDSKGGEVGATDGMADLLPAKAFPKPATFRVDPLRGVDFGSSSGRSYYLVSARLADASGNSPGYLVQAALDCTAEQRVLSEYRHWLWLELGLGLGTSFLIGYVIAHRGLRPIGHMAATMRSIGASTLHERLTLEGLPGELTALATTFNQMLDRLEDAFARLSQFSADIAHELRTPISNLRGEAEVVLSKARTTEEYREALASGLEECQRLSQLVDNLLFLARAENPETQINRQRTNLADELTTIRDFYAVLCEESGTTLRVVCDPALVAEVDRPLFQQAIGNLIDNALAYTPADGSITVRGKQTGDALEIEVGDTGCGISTEHLPRIFDRFYRADSARGRNMGGSGLGLAIVRSIATLHGGDVTVDSQPGQGTQVALRLPAVR